MDVPATRSTFLRSLKTVAALALVFGLWELTAYV